MNVLLKAILLMPILIPIWWCWFVITAIPCSMLWLCGLVFGLQKDGNFWCFIGYAPMFPWRVLMYIIKTRYIIRFVVDGPEKYIYIYYSNVTGEYILDSLSSTTDIIDTPKFPSRRSAEKLIKKICDRYELSKPEDYVVEKVVDKIVLN